MCDVKQRQQWNGSDDLLTLDWASVGRLVRRTTLEAVALHFAVIGTQSKESGPSVAAGERNTAGDR